jgi:hypothetical protein
MTFTYTDPVNGVYANPKDEVRFLLQDTVQNDFSLDDEEIYYLLKQFGDKVYLAASQGALQLSVAYAKEATIASKSVGDVSLSLSYMDTSAEYKHLSGHLRLGKIDTSLATYFVDTEMQFTTGQFDDNRY